MQGLRRYTFYGMLTWPKMLKLTLWCLLFIHTDISELKHKIYPNLKLTKNFANFALDIITHVYWSSSIKTSVTMLQRGPHWQREPCTWLEKEEPTKLHVCPANPQIRLGIGPVWSVLSGRLKKAWVLSYPMSAQGGLIRLALLNPNYRTKLLNSGITFPMTPFIWSPTTCIWPLDLPNCFCTCHVLKMFTWPGLQLCFIEHIGR